MEQFRDLKLLSFPIYNMSNKNEIKDIQQLLEESLGNVRQDRARSITLLTDIMMFIGKQPDRNEKFGQVAAKYLEVLQRSNEQLVKIAELLRKKQSVVGGLSDDDKEDIYDDLESGDDGNDK